MKILYAHLSEEKFGMGGADHSVLNLISGIREKFQDEVYCVLNPGPLAAELRKKSIPVAEISRKKIKTLQTLRAFGRIFSSFKPDLVHSHHRYTTFLLDLFFKSKGIPILHTQRVETSDKKLLFRFGHFVTAVSDALRQILIARYNVPPDRVATVRNAVPSRPPDSRIVAELRERYPRREQQWFALCTGRFEEQKGHLYLIQAVARLPKADRERLKIFLAGEGPWEPKLKAEIERAHLGPYFIFLGYCPCIPEILALCDFLILPSLWEGLPRSVLEALNAGKAVLATKVSGTAEIIRDNQNGLLVPPKDSGALAKAICDFIHRPDELRRMGKEAQKSAELFSFDQMLLEYHGLYQKLSRDFGKSSKR